MLVLAELVAAFGEALGEEVLAELVATGVADLLETLGDAELVAGFGTGVLVGIGLAGVTLTEPLESVTDSLGRVGLVMDPR